MEVGSEITELSLLGMIDDVLMCTDLNSVIASLPEECFYYLKDSPGGGILPHVHALQQNREQDAQSCFEMRTIEVGIGMKNNSSVDFEISVFLHMVP